MSLSWQISRVKTMVFPEVMYRCESWTIMKAEHQRTDAFELWCWRSLLRATWAARRSNQSILKEINPEYSLEGLMLKLKLQYFGHLTRRTDSLEKTLMLKKIEGRKKRGPQRMRWLDSVQLLSRVWLFVTPWTAASQASLSFTSPGACSNSCPLSQWCHPTISSFVVPFSSCFQSFPASGSFQMSQLFTSGGQSIGVST